MFLFSLGLNALFVDDECRMRLVSWIAHRVVLCS